MKIKDIIRIDVTEEEIKNVFQRVIDNRDISKLDNLRNRHKNIRFDCLLRGYIGECAMTKWLQSENITIEQTNFIPEGDHIDIDFSYKNRNIELKTSLIPDTDKTIDFVIQHRDIKLIKRGKSTIEELPGDIHLQIYYSQKRKAKDDWLCLQKINLESEDIDYLYDAFLARAYKNTTYFVGWIDKPSVIAHIQSLPEEDRFWSFKNSRRFFWNYKIRDARKPSELILHLNRL